MRELFGIVLTFIIICGIIAIFVIADDVGDAINRNSIQKSLNIKQARNQNQSEWELKQSERERTAPARIKAMESFWHTARVVGSVTITVICIAGGIWIVGLSKSEVKKANFEATQLKLDPVTRTYPLLFFEAGNKMRVHDPNTQTTLAIDGPNTTNQLLAAYSTAIQMQTLAGQDREVNSEVLLQLAAEAGRE